ncbi:hypothetical protein SAMN05216474_2183 [Lishizhenia tianjinensis]|uniref:Chloroplast import component protein (Tic20) n=1 Tax=Lishizhenia tianjinensis TaxID=477690 RepID=A0A1I7AKK1_9FLAO|nr:hypothetical protein [Lishizhenia tianjinensis]SFT75499.1 hypothetical protein SAMN05216474_2183 [Lishizhenia tianjinensis]
MEKNKLPSIITYITFIGFVVALVLNNDKQGDDKRFNAFHLRQSLGIFIIMAVVSTLLQILHLYTISGLFNLLCFIVIILQIVGAANEEYKYVPYIGKKIDQTFGRLFE